MFNIGQVETFAGRIDHDWTIALPTVRLDEHTGCRQAGADWHKQADEQTSVEELKLLTVMFRPPDL